MSPSNLKTVAQLLKLPEVDNVLVAVGSFESDPTVSSGGDIIEVKRPVTLGHKIACRDIVTGEEIVKYGVSIGSDTSNISDNAEIADLMASAAHMTLFIAGRGSVLGSAISPVIKICANPTTCKNLQVDMEINAGTVLEGTSLKDVGNEIYNQVLAIASGVRTKSEALGHSEFILTYKSFEPIGPSCLPT